MDAGGQEIAETHLQIEVVQIFQEAVPRIIGEVGQMVAVDFIHSAAGHLHDLAPHIPIGGGAVPLFQSGEDGGVMLLAHLPQVRLPRPTHRAGVRNVKDVFQAGLPPPVFSYDRYALGTGLHPAAHSAVPQLHAGTGGSVRALDVDQELFIKGVFLKMLSRRNVRLLKLRPCTLVLAQEQ